ENQDAVLKNCENRKAPTFPIERVVAFETKRKKLVQQRSETAAKQNEISKGFQKATPAEREALKAQSTKLKEEVAAIDAELRIVEGDLLSNLIIIPNMTHPDAPVGGEDANKVISKSGTPRSFDFKAKDHVAICDSLDLCDFEAGAKV